MSSSSDLDPGLRRRDLWLLGLICLVSVGLYLAVSAIYYRVGFPLDDSWIHQTYARNLAQRGEWAFQPGQPSGGSTAPLWTALLAIGAWLHLAPFVWTYLLGFFLLWALAALGERAVRGWSPSYRPGFPWVGAVLAMEWHLVWAADSGMETLLQAFLSTLVLVLLISGRRPYFQLGLLIGLSVWIRPDGITLLGPACLAILVQKADWRKRLRGLFNLWIGFGVLFGFYLLFNLAFAGSPWPSTFYAKQAEYQVYQQIPFLTRLAQQLLQPLVGVGLVLLPGVLLSLVTAIRNRAWGLLLGMAWMAGYLGLYALRLPVVYQHGRYAIPVMPLFLLFGLYGLIGFLQSGRIGNRLIPLAWKLLTAVLLLVFWARGSFAYAQDVAVIESEMVATAKWVAENLPAVSLVAAHDIGALGYYGNHRLVDLAGLISPDVIPFIRNEERLSVYLDKRQVDYLVAFPDWYPLLTAGREPIFSTRAPFAPALGSTNLAVYVWRGP